MKLLRLFDRASIVKWCVMCSFLPDALPTMSIQGWCCSEGPLQIVCWLSHGGAGGICRTTNLNLCNIRGFAHSNDFTWMAKQCHAFMSFHSSLHDCFCSSLRGRIPILWFRWNGMLAMGRPGLWHVWAFDASQVIMPQCCQQWLPNCVAPVKCDKSNQMR